MKSIINFSVRHPISILMIFTAIALLGLIALSRLGIDYMPTMGNRRLYVVTEYPGIIPSEIRRTVAFPLERSLSSMKSLKNTETLCRTGICIITLNFKFSTDINLAMIECRQIVDETYRLLPSLCEKPNVFKSDTKNSTLSVVCIPKDGDLVAALHLCETDIGARFRRLESVGEVKILGGEKAEIKISVDKSALESRQITLSDVAAVISGANYEYPAGTVKQGDKEVILKTMGRFQNLAEIEDYCLFFNNGNVLKVGNIANVHREIANRENFFTYNGKPGIKIDVYNKTDSDPIKTASEIKALLKELSVTYFEHFDFTVISDESVEIKSALINVLLSSLLGMIVTSAVIYTVFRKFVLSVIISSIIPCSFLFSVLCLFLFGKTLNLMSLSGIAIGVGMVVDGGTVVLENILRKFAVSPPNRNLIAQGTREVLLSNTASMLTTNIVFLPIFIISGILSELFADMAISIISTITFSTVASFTLLPSLFSLVDISNFTEIKETRLLNSLKFRYKKILEDIFENPAFTPTCLVLCCILGGAFFLLLPKELMEKTNSAEAEIEIQFRTNSSVDGIMTKCAQLYKKMETAGFRNVSFRCGAKENDFSLLADCGFREENAYLSFDLPRKNPEETLEKAEQILQEENFSYSLISKNDFLSSALDFPQLSIIVFGKDDKASLENAKKCAPQGIILPNEKTMNYGFSPNRIFMARLNTDNSSSAALMREITQGITITPFYENSLQIPMKVELAEKTETPDDIENFFAILGENISLPIKFLGQIFTETNEGILYRYNQKDARLVSQTHFSPKDGIEFTDLKKERMNELFFDSAFLLIAVFAFLYLILAAQFESFFLPILLLISLPPAFFGAFACLVLFGKTVNVNVCIGLIILFGISVNNSILLYESCKKSSSKTKSQIIFACTEKFRAIFVTNATSILALCPFVANFTGTNTQSSLAVTVIGGLIASTLTVLLIMPSLFALWEKKRL